MRRIYREVIGIVINKDLLVFEWAAQFPILSEPLLFSYLAEQDGAAAIVPIQGDAVVKWHIDGSSVREYSFALQLLRRISDSTDNTNTGNVFILRQWVDWIMEQERIGSYPDFGARCSDYSLEVLSNMPMLAQKFDNDMGMYQFFARLNYREESDYGQTR